MIEGFNLPAAIDMMVAVEQARIAPIHEGDRHDQSQWGELKIALDAIPNTDLIADPRTNRLIGVGTCGTARCAAGWVLANANIPVRWDLIGTDRNGIARYVADHTADGEEVDIKASRVLGIIGPFDDYYDEDADWYSEEEGYPTLFEANNTVDDLYRIVADYAGVPEREVRAQVHSRINVPLAVR